MMNNNMVLCEIDDLFSRGLLCDRTSKSLTRATSTLICTEAIGIRRPAIFATVNEDIHLEWTHMNKVLLVEFLRSGNINVCIDDLMNSSTQEFKLPSNVTSEDVAELIAETILSF